MTEDQRDSARGLVTAGLIVSLVGLAAAGIRVWAIPGYAIPLVVGAALLVAGAVRRHAAGG
jgi:hypothetical protein